MKSIRTIYCNCLVSIPECIVDDAYEIGQYLCDVIDDYDVYICKTGEVYRAPMASCAVVLKRVLDVDSDVWDSMSLVDKWNYQNYDGHTFKSEYTPKNGIIYGAIISEHMMI